VDAVVKMKCKFCLATFDELKKLNTHANIDHPKEKAEIDLYLYDTDLKLKSIEIELIESTSMYRHARQTMANIAMRKED